LSCFCGAQVIYPPIPCGVKPPACTNICTRAHPCGHQIYHNCHNEEHCPPCTALTEKYCHGKHELRKSVACHIDGISCGRPCGKLILSCRRHTCTKACHSGECDPNCSQPCKELRSNCGHPCNSTCHDGPCPNTSCMEKVKMNCSCGNLSSVVICSNNSGLHTALLADHIRDLNNGNSSSTTSISLKDLGKRIDKLECNEECAKLERNRRVALALQIENPDLTTKLAAPKYSEFLKEVTRKDLSFATMVHEKLTELVRLAKESKHKSRSHSFDVMNREKRQFVHELTDHFGIESESYDAEPKRNVVATAFKDRVWLPSQSILDVVQGLRKAPAPIAINPTPKPTFTTLQPSSMLKIPSTTSNDDETTHKPVVDYFDFDG
jgi:transcriptional repressor NF-X1